MSSKEHGAQTASTRRQFVQQAAAAALSTALIAPLAPQASGKAPRAARSSSGYFDLQRAPDLIQIFTEDGDRKLSKEAGGRWTSQDAVVTTAVTPSGLNVSLSASNTGVKRIHLRWNGAVAGGQRFLGDHWERAYGDLEWRGVVPDRAMPWYFAAWDGARTHGYGVMTGPAAFCFWQTDSDGISLWADVRSGGKGLRLGSRALDVCTVVSRPGKGGETPFAALHAFCRQMCPQPRLADHSIYGHNDWDFAYGNNSAASTLEAAHLLASLSPAGKNRPYVVIDDGWEPAGPGKAGPWDGSNSKFPDMPGLTSDVRKAGARPGIWIRPTTAWEAMPDPWRIDGKHGSLDPTVPEVKAQIEADMARLAGWGFELIKHDFSSVDILGRFGSGMGSGITDDHWKFREGQGRTTAEVVLDLYQTMRKGAGSAVVLGCNTFSHLSAGIFEACRIGDDTSGRDWERTRKMGVNCLAFRNAQNRAFYATDPDIAPITHDVPWEKTAQWLDLVARSGSVLFTSLDMTAVGPVQREALREALALAAAGQPLGEPIDWLETTCPQQWRLGGEMKQYRWQNPEGASPFNV
ncbi:hypothetical protein CCAX7_32200 [Capsulimonas corticalis]|uniref:Uncharacterized protein n=1 Tax=Capsulimonas corticalis TaxID=2219043 RepID=A0A402D4B9_9BACT|nr:twin-arginine translocation signal domain-containing protein [Capsulimonas corticalis]BDI31169.1 hypothetical protein CCAX7_32200 [Capsulimonas corticalis]